MNPIFTTKILVTGGAGFIGSHLVDMLVKMGCDVRVIDNLSRGKLEFIQDHIQSGKIEFENADIRDFQAVHKAVSGVDLIFHLAAQASVMGTEADSEYSFDTNVKGTYHILRAAHQSGRNKTMIFASSREVYGEPNTLPVHEDAPLIAKNLYGASKIAAEAYCRLYNSADMSVSILRLSNVYGPRDQDRVIPLFLDCIKQAQPLTLFGGEQIIDFVPVDLVVSAFVRAAKICPADPVNIGSGRSTTIKMLAERIIDLGGAQVGLNILASRQVEVEKFTADIKRMRRILEIDPPVDPLIGLPAMVSGC
jgi:nucleoside-diphosphate-sugar epimerase